jgi:predicted RNA-binding Zn-ribbon protein involved in translation (DUF1610 family)
MMPENKECRICRNCLQLVVHPHIFACPECGGQEFWTLEEILEFWVMKYGED